MKEILIYGPIGMGFGMTAEEVIEQLAGANGEDVLVRINSAGGSFDEGPAIYNALKTYSGRMDTEIDGIAYSMAALILQAGTTRRMAENSVVMVHGSQHSVQGSAEDLRKTADMMDVHTSAMLSAFTGRGIDEDAAKAWLEDGEDHFFNAEQALAAGLIDEVSGAVDMTAALDRIPADISLPLQIAAYRIPPTIGDTTMPDPKALETKPVDQAAKPIDVTAFSATRDRNIKDGQKTGQKGEMDRQNGIRAFFDRPQFSDVDRIGEANASAFRDLQDTCLASFSTSVQAAKDLALDLQDGIQAPILSVETQTQAPSSSFGHISHKPPARRGAAVVHDSADKYVEGVTAAMEIKTSLVTDRKLIDAQGSNEFLGMTMVEMARRFLDVHNQPLVGVRREQVIGQALTMSGAGIAHGSSDFSNLLENIANKSMMMGWTEAPETWSQWARTGTLPDFKQGSRVNMSTFGDLDIVLENGEYKYGSFSDLKEVLQLATFGKLFGISRQALANDDLSALSGIPRGMGRAAARKIGDLAYNVLIANPLLNQDGIAVFAAGHSNLGTGGAPSVTTMDEARQLMALQQDPAGNTLNIRPAHLIVPVALQTTSETLMAATYDPAGTAGTLTPNPFQNSVDVIADARLDVDDPAQWYLTANGNTFDTVEVAFLNGQSAPYLEAQDGWRVDGQEYKVRIDAVAAPLDFRTMVRNAGA